MNPTLQFQFLPRPWVIPSLIPLTWWLNWWSFPSRDRDTEIVRKSLCTLNQLFMTVESHFIVMDTECLTRIHGDLILQNVWWLNSHSKCIKRGSHRVWMSHPRKSTLLQPGKNKPRRRLCRVLPLMKSKLWVALVVVVRAKLTGVHKSEMQQSKTASLCPMKTFYYELLFSLEILEAVDTKGSCHGRCSEMVYFHRRCFWFTEDWNVMVSKRQQASQWFV